MKRSKKTDAGQRPVRVPSATGRDAGTTQPDVSPRARGVSPAAGATRGLRPWLVLAAIVLVGLLLRASYLREIQDAPDFEAPRRDAEMYDYWARAMLSGDWTPPPGRTNPQIPATPYTRPPGYPYFLALVYWLSGDGYWAARAVQMTLGLLSTILMFILGRGLFGRRVGLLAAFFVATYWVFIYFEGELNSPSLVIFLVLCVMNMLRKWLEKPTFVRAFLAGLLLGALAVVRPEALPFLAVVLVWAWWALRRREATRRILLAVGAIVCGFALPVAPVTVRNLVAGRELVLVCTSGGVNLYAGNNALSDGTGARPDLSSVLGVARGWSSYDMPVAIQALESKLGRHGITHGQFSRYFVRLGLQYIRDHPLATLRLVGRKALLFWGPAEISNNKVLHYEKANSVTLRYLPGFPFVAAPFVLGVLMLASHRHAQRRKKAGAAGPPGPAGHAWPPELQFSVLLLLYIAVCFLVLLPFDVPARFRVPIIPYGLLFGAYGFCRLADLFRARDWTKLAGWGIAAIGMAAVFSIPLVPYEQERARWHYDRARAYKGSAKLDAAIGEFRQAAEINGSDQPYYQTVLGVQLAILGRLDEAIQCHERALKAQPRYALAHANLAQALYDKGELDAAQAHSRTALLLDPVLTKAHNTLGAILIDVGRLDEAVGEFARVLELNPYDDSAHYHWGRALGLLGKPKGAIEHLTKAQSNNPHNPDIPNKLALLLAGQGDVDQAIRHYQRALELDPHFAPAHINLAVTLADQGRFEEALEHYETGRTARGEATEAPPTLGAMLEKLGKRQSAAALYDAVPETKQGDAQTHIDLAKELAIQGKLQEALEQYLEAVCIEPENADAYFNLGAVSAVMKHYEQAIGYYTKAVDLSPKDTEAIVRLGKLLVLTGDMDEAIKRFRDALEIDSDNASARTCLERALDQKASQVP